MTMIKKKLKIKRIRIEVEMSTTKRENNEKKNLLAPNWTTNRNTCHTNKKRTNDSSNDTIKRYCCMLEGVVCAA